MMSRARFDFDLLNHARHVTHNPQGDYRDSNEHKLPLDLAIHSFVFLFNMKELFGEYSSVREFQLGLSKTDIRFERSPHTPVGIHADPLRVVCRL